MDDAQKEIQAVLDKHNLELGYQINFPQYKIIPDEVKLAMLVMKNNGMVIQFVLEEKK